MMTRLRAFSSQDKKDAFKTSPHERGIHQHSSFTQAYVESSALSHQARTSHFTGKEETGSITHDSK